MDSQAQQWTQTLSRYVERTIMPDGRDTFESTPLLAQTLYRLSSRKGGSLADLGCGTGKSFAPFVGQYADIVGIDADAANLAAARQTWAGHSEIRLVEGEIGREDLPGYAADTVLTSLFLHQIPPDRLPQALKTIRRLLKPDGEWLMADELILFDAGQDAAKFDRVYRYLLEHTVPHEVYERQIKPYLLENHIYTWREMQENTPPEYRFRSLAELEKLLAEAGLFIETVEEITPFFGCLKIKAV